MIRALYKCTTLLFTLLYVLACYVLYYIILAYVQIVADLLLYTTSYCSAVFLVFCYFAQTLLIILCTF